jgi:hypothetical protein
LSPFGQEPNDGIVAVSETVLAGEPILLPVIHTFMMNAPSVHRLLLGTFSQPTGPLEDVSPGDRNRPSVTHMATSRSCPRNGG